MPSSSHHLTVNSLRFRHLEAAPPDPDPNTLPILLHGFPTSSHLYRNILPELGKTHRAIAIDLPGNGLSDKPFDAKHNFAFFEHILEGFCDALGIGPPTSSSHSGTEQRPAAAGPVVFRLLGCGRVRCCSPGGSS